jgi:beta-N-acetylhexosaminidase
VLRNDLAFTGTIVTDALEMRALADDIGIVEGFVRSLLAGADAIETGAQDAGPLIEPIVAATERAVDEGRLPLERLADAARRTAALGGLAAPAHTSVGLDGPGSDLAARCLEVRGPLPILRAPLVVECRTPNGVATGELPWSLAEAVAARIAGTEIMPVDGPVSTDAVASRAQGRSLVVVVRDPHRHPWQQSLLDSAVGHHDSVIVDVGWPAEALPRGVPLVRTRGIAPGLLTAAACLLSGAGVRA